MVSMMSKKVGCFLRTFTQLKEMELVDPNEETIGQCCDIAFEKNGEITHIIYQKKGMLGKKYCIPLQQVLQVQQTKLIVVEDQHEKYCTDIGECTLYHHESIHSKQIITQNDEALGLVDDVYLSDNLDKIIGYELTDGFFSDIANGKRTVHRTAITHIGDEAIEMFVNKRSEESSNEMSKLQELKFR